MNEDSKDADCGFFRENEQLETKNIVEDSGVILPVVVGDGCMYCKGLPLDKEILTCFKKAVCYDCNKSKLKFITKTSCKDLYLLNDEEIKQFSCLSRPNPHKGTWNDMQLYLESEIINYSIQKYGSAEKIAEIKNEKKEKKKSSKLKKIKKQVQALKQRTFLKPVKEKHVHKFVKKHAGCSACDCGMEIEEEEI